MAWGIIGGAAITVVGGMVASNQAKQAAKGAAGAQEAAAQAGIDEQRRQFDAVQALLKPYVDAGNSSLTSQQDILGTNGPEAQQKAIAAIQSSPQFAAMNQVGTNSILQNASATGGLRGGNTQAALAQFQPQLLSSLIDQQYSRLGGISQMGQSAAAMQSSAGMQTGNNITNLLGQQGSAQAGGILANGQANSNLTNSIFGAAGTLWGSGAKAGWFNSSGGGGKGAGGGAFYNGGF